MKKKIGVIFISLLCFVTMAVWMTATDETLASDTQEVSCVVGDANYDEAFDVGDLVRLKRHLNTTELECSMDGDLDVSGDLGSTDVVRCREMLVGDKSLQVTVEEEDWYKQLKDADGYYAYYTLNKSLQEGWTLTFKVDFKENKNCSVYGYYPGCDNWVHIGEQSDGNSFSVVAAEDIAYLNIRVANADNLTTVSDFRVYDIQVIKSAQGGEVEDLVITYNQTTQMPVVYGTSDTLDMTKFGVQTSAKDLSYKWTLKQTGVSGTTTSVDMTSTAYQFSSTGNYTLTATVNTEGYSGSVSAKIMVVNPKIYVGFDGGTVKNTGTASNTVGAYAMNAESSATSFTTYSGTVSYTTDINGNAGEAIVTNHKTGPYTVVKDYEFGTSNFTVSAWINVPKAVTLSGGSATYLFGTMNPGGTDGFALTLKEGELRVKVLDNSANMPAVSFERDSWYNVTVKRESTSFKIYFDGEMVKEYTISSTDTFGTKDLAFGAYHGVTYVYQDANMRYDDIQIYGSAISDATIQALSSVDTVGPDVVIDYNKGRIENTGMDQSINVGAYTLKSDGSDFASYTDTVDYTTGIQAESNGAIVTNHRNGPYTVIEDYNLGADDFTVSAWFNVPDKSKLGNNSQAYLFGTDYPDTKTGFAVCIKYNKEYQLRIKVGSNSASFYNISDFESNTWYHLAACRDGSDLRWYLNGTLILTVSDVTTDYEKQDISFGAAKNWATSKYGDFDVYFDNVEIYGSAVATKYFKEEYNSTAIAPRVIINYTDRTVANSGIDTDIAVGTYKMDATSKATMFVTEPAVPYTMGAAYDKGGAISTNHYDGAYTVVRDYVFGTNNFTVSAWVKIPENEELATGSGTYLFGNDNADTADGFALSFMNENNASKLRLRLCGTTSKMEITYEKGEWYHVAVTREGATVKVYFDGAVVGTYSDTITADYDFGTDDLSFGAYHGVSWAHKDANTHFDEIKVYNGVLSADEIATVAETDLGSSSLSYTDESTTITNSELFYTNDRTISGADPSCIYVTEGEYAGWYIAYIGFNSSTQVKCYKSKDLVTWKTADSSTSRCFSPDADSWGVSDIWAPEVYYDETDKTYYMFYSATNQNDEDGYKCLGLATSESPIGPFIDIGNPVFDGATLASKNTNYEKAGFIDASPFVDPETGDKYLYMTRNRDAHDSNIISVVKMNDWKTPDYSTYQELTTVNKTEYNGTVGTERVESGEDGNINEASQMTYYNGTYYLTMSIRGTTESEYSVIQALGDSPTGPFTKVQESDGGVILGIDLEEDYAWDHISCSGSHSFINAGDEWFVLYHTHSDPTNIGDGYTRSLALERMTWTTNSKGQTIMKSVGPTTSVQPKPASYSGYINIAPKATMIATNTASDSKASYLNDGLVRVLSTDCVEQFEGSGDVTITMTFDEFVTAKSLLIYNSWKYADAFESVSSVTFKYGEVVDGVTRIGTKTITDLNFNMDAYSYTNSNGKTVMIPGSPMVLTFDEMEIIEVSIVIPCPSGKSSVAVSEIMLLGEALEDKADLHVSYNNGTMSYTSSDDAVTVGAYELSSIDKDASSTFENYAGALSYTTGVAGDEKGALVTNNAFGPYTVIKGYDFGTGDFTISTWFKVPSGETIQSSGNYIFGIDNPDGTTGFSACIKYTDADGYQLRFRGLNKTMPMYNLTDFSFDTWYHLTLCREGTSLNWYLNGTLVGAQTIAATTDYETTALAVGAYTGWGTGTYKNTDICFDEVKIYGSALSQKKISALTAGYKN